jgi:hypothetical protein
MNSSIGDYKSIDDVGQDIVTQILKQAQRKALQDIKGDKKHLYAGNTVDPIDKSKLECKCLIRFYSRILKTLERISKEPFEKNRHIVTNIYQILNCNRKELKRIELIITSINRYIIYNLQTTITFKADCKIYLQPDDVDNNELYNPEGFKDCKCAKYHYGYIITYLQELYNNIKIQQDQSQNFVYFQEIVGIYKCFKEIVDKIYRYYEPGPDGLYYKSKLTIQERETSNCNNA